MMNETAPHGYGMGMYAMGPGGLIFAIVILVLVVWAFWRIFAKAGYSGAWGLLAIVPLMQFFLLLFLAFATWPRQRDRIE